MNLSWLFWNWSHSGSVPLTLLRLAFLALALSPKPRRGLFFELHQPELGQRTSIAISQARGNRLDKLSKRMATERTTGIADQPRPNTDTMEERTTAVSHTRQRYACWLQRLITDGTFLVLRRRPSLCEELAIRRFMYPPASLSMSIQAQLRWSFRWHFRGRCDLDVSWSRRRRMGSLPRRRTLGIIFEEIPQLPELVRGKYAQVR